MSAWPVNPFSASSAASSPIRPALPQWVDLVIVPVLALTPPARDAEMAIAIRVRSASSPSITDAAAALPITPTSPGGWNPPSPSAADATRMRPCTSKPVTSAVSAAGPPSPRSSASARMPGSVGEVACVAGCHITS